MIEPTGRAIPSIIWSCWESPELEFPPVPLALVCEGLDAEDADVAEVRSAFESVVDCEERPPGVEVVVAPVAPVAPATGTSAEPAVTYARFGVSIAPSRQDS